MDPALILKRNVEKERNLRTLRENTKLNASEISTLLTQIRNDYEILIVEHTSYTCSGASKDIDESLWKQCFYRQIEEYRKSIRKTVQILDQPEDAGTTTTVNLALKARTHLARLTCAFAKFLSDGSIFYQELMLKLESQFKVLRLNESGENILHCIYRCLLYLGDLARYRELYSDSRDKDYSEAERYYERGAFLVPTAGNPQNQLAVLASYTENTECVAVYHYCRSVMVLKPFAAGFDNLSLIFEKNIRLYMQSKSEAAQDNLRSNNNNNKIMSIRIKSFLIRFIRLHGDLFLYTRRAIKSIIDTVLRNSNGIDYLPEVEKHNNELKEFDVKSFLLLNQEVLDDFEYLISASAFSETLLLKLLVISLFSVHHGASILSVHSSQTDSTPIQQETGRETNGNLKKNVSKVSNSMDRSVTESLALSFLFALVNKSASRLRTVTKSADKSNSVYAFRILPLLSVFAEWGGLNTKYFLPINPAMGRDQQNIVSEGILLSVRGGSDLMLMEGRSKSSVRASLSSLQDLIESNIRSGNIGARTLSDYKGKPLIEHNELRGFLPLSKRYEVFFYGIDPLARHLPTVADETARDRRLRVLSAFIVDWPVSNPDVQTSPISSSLLSHPPLVTTVEVSVTQRPALISATSSSTDSGSTERGMGTESKSQLDFRSARQVERVRSESQKVEIGGLLEKRAGLLIVAPGAILAAREKEKERERNIERAQHERSQGRRRERRGRLENGVLVPRRERGGKRIRERRLQQQGRERERDNLKHLADPDYNRDLLKRREGRGSRAVNQSQNQDQSKPDIEEFPPLPGAREPHLQPTNLGYASSAIFSSSAPSFDANPFKETDEDDDSDDSDDDEDDEGSSVSDSDDDYEAGLDDYHIGDTEGESEVGQQSFYVEEEKWDLGIGIDMTLKVPDSPVPSKMTASGVFGGLFSGSNSNMSSLFGGYSSPLAELMSDTAGTGNGINTPQSIPYDDDDFADDVVVFRPAFSRINAVPSPSLPLPPLMGFTGEVSSSFSTYVGGSSITTNSGNSGNLAVGDNQNGINNYGLGPSMISRSPLRSSDVMSTSKSQATAIQENNISTKWQPWNSNDNSLKPYLESPIHIPLGGSGSPIVYGQSYDKESAYIGNKGDWNRNVEDSDHFGDWWGENNPNISEKLQSIQLPPPAQAQSLRIGPDSLPRNEGYSRNMRGPPAMQRISSVGAIPRSTGETGTPTPMPPPGLAAPPGLSGNVHAQQQGSATWTANPFYKNIG